MGSCPKLREIYENSRNGVESSEELYNLGRDEVLREILAEDEKQIIKDKFRQAMHPNAPLLSCATCGVREFARDQNYTRIFLDVYQTILLCSPAQVQTILIAESYAYILYI